MLIWMRNSTFAGAMKFVLMGLLLLALAGLVFTDVGGYFSGNMTSNTIVKGAGINIGVNEFDRTVQRFVRNQGTSAAEAYKLGVIDQMASSEIRTRLFSKQSHDLGLIVHDEDVTKKIAQLAEPLATEGRSKKDALQQVLMTQGISEKEFIATVRTEMANGLLGAALQAPATLTSPLMAKTLYRYDNEKRAADIIVLSNATVTDVSAPSDEQLQKYYEANKSAFLIPESRTITVATLKTDMLKKNIKISDDRLKQEYEKNIDSFTKQAPRVVEQTVLNTEEEAKAAIADLKAGKPLKGTETKEYQRSELLPPVAEAVFNAGKGDVVGPVRSNVGWHVAVIKDIKEDTVAPFEDVKQKLHDELERIALTEELYNAGNTIEDRAAGGDKLEDIVSEYGMTTEIIGPFRRNGNDSNGNDKFKSFAEDREKLIQTAFDYDAGEIAPIVETADGQFHLIHIDQVIPDSYRDLASVKPALEKEWMNEQRRLANKDRAKVALDALNAGKTLADVAKEQSASVQTLNGVNRKSTPPAPLNAVAAAQIFTTEIGKGFSSEIQDGYIVGTVKDVMMPANIPADSKELAALDDLTGRSMAQELVQEYITSLANGKKISINKARLDQLYGTQQPQQ